MMISTRGRYALRAIVDIAEQKTGEYVPLKEIAKRQEMSEKYLESILSALTRAGILAGLRGKGGGDKLAVAPESCTIGRILKIVEDRTVMVACLEHNPNRCTRARECRTLPMWEKLQSTVDAYLESVTIASLCKPAH